MLSISLDIVFLLWNIPILVFFTLIFSPEPIIHLVMSSTFIFTAAKVLVTSWLATPFVHTSSVQLTVLSFREADADVITLLAILQGNRGQFDLKLKTLRNLWMALKDPKVTESKLWIAPKNPELTIKWPFSKLPFSMPFVICLVFN